MLINLPPLKIEPGTLWLWDLPDWANLVLLVRPYLVMLYWFPLHHISSTSNASSVLWSCFDNMWFCCDCNPAFTLEYCMLIGPGAMWFLLWMEYLYYYWLDSLILQKMAVFVLSGDWILHSDWLSGILLLKGKRFCNIEKHLFEN